MLSAWATKASPERGAMVGAVFYIKPVLCLASLRSIIPISLLIKAVKSRYVICERSWGMDKTLDKILIWDLL